MKEDLTDQNAHNEKSSERRRNDGPFKWTPVLVAVISSIIGGGGGVALVFSTPFGQNMARPNAWTSIQAQVEHRAIDKRLVAFETHVRDHPDVGIRQIIADIRADMSATKARQEVIIKNQDRILDKLNQ